METTKAEEPKHLNSFTRRLPVLPPPPTPSRIFWTSIRGYCARSEREHVFWNCSGRHFNPGWWRASSGCGKRRYWCEQKDATLLKRDFAMSVPPFVVAAKRQRILSLPLYKICDEWKIRMLFLGDSPYTLIARHSEKVIDNNCRPPSLPKSFRSAVRYIEPQKVLIANNSSLLFVSNVLLCCLWLKAFLTIDSCLPKQWVYFTGLASAKRTRNWGIFSTSWALMKCRVPS